MKRAKYGFLVRLWCCGGVCGELKNNWNEDIVHQHLQDTQAAYLACFHVKRKLEYEIKRGANYGKVAGKCVALYGAYFN